MKLPSIKTIQTRLNIDYAKAFRIRFLLESYQDRNPDGFARPIQTLSKISEELGFHGVETIDAGSNKNSPPIVYANSGDTYTNTVLWTPGKFIIGNWGSIVERGSYV
jgi:hypothetical protein